MDWFEWDKLDEASLLSVHFNQIHSLLVFDHLRFTNGRGVGGGGGIAVQYHKYHYCGALYSAGVKMLTIV